MQTLILRFVHLDEAVTRYYTDLLMGRVWPRSGASLLMEPAAGATAVTPTTTTPMAQAVSEFIVPRNGAGRPGEPETGTGRIGFRRWRPFEKKKGESTIK